MLGLGDPFSVSVLARRGAPRTVSLRWRESDTDWRGLTLAPVTGDPDSTFHVRLEAPPRSFEYYVRAGDFRSERFRVEVCERPHPVRFDVEYRFPDYLEMSSKTESRPGGDVATVAGTTARVTVTCDRDLARARIKIDGEDLEARPLSVDGTRTSYELPIRRDTSYRLFLEDHRGVNNAWSTVPAIRSLTDRPPRLRVIQPRRKRLEIEPGRRVPLKLELRDDFAIDAAGLEVNLPRGGVRDIPLPTPRPRPEAHVLDHLWEVSELELRAGERIAFRFFVEDARKQRARSEEYSLTLALLPSPPEGRGWHESLTQVQTQFDEAVLSWTQLLHDAVRSTGDVYPADRALAEELERIVIEIPGQLESWRRLAAKLRPIADFIAIPSIHRQGLHDLARRLEDAAEGEGMAAWRAGRETIEAIRRASADPAAATKEEGTEEKGSPRTVDARALRSAEEAARGSLVDLRDRWTALHRLERLEEALDRSLALVDLHEEAFDRIDGDAESDPRSALRLEAIILGEAGVLAGELAQIAVLGGERAGKLEVLAQTFTDIVGPALRRAIRALKATDDPVPLTQPLRRVREALTGRTRALRPPLQFWTEKVKRSWRELRRDSEVADALKRVSEYQAGAAQRLTDAADQLEVKGPDAKNPGAIATEVADSLEGQLDASLRRARKRVAELALRSATAQPPDFESARDLTVFDAVLMEARQRDVAREATLFRSMRSQTGPERDGTPEATPVEALRQLIRSREQSRDLFASFQEIASTLMTGFSIGQSEGRLDASRAVLDGIGRRLLDLDRSQRRTLRSLARSVRELEGSTRESIVTLSRLAAERADTDFAAEISRALEPLRESLNACAALVRELREGEPALARELTLAASQLLLQGADGLSRVRAEHGSELEDARLELRRQGGSLAERLKVLAAEEGALASGDADEDSPTAPPPTAPTAPQELWMHRFERQRMLRVAVRRLGRLVSLEAAHVAVSTPSGGISSSTASTRAVTVLDACSTRLAALADDELARAEIAFERAASDAEERPRFAGEARKLAAAAAEVLTEWAETLRSLDEKTTLERTDELLSSLSESEDSRGDRNGLDDLDSLRERSRRYLKALDRSLRSIRLRLDDGALKNRLVELLEASAAAFRTCLAAISQDDDESEASARRSFATGRRLLGEALALVKSRTQNLDNALAARERSPAADGPQRETSPEIRALEEELRRLMEVRGWQRELEKALDGILREAEPFSEKLAELAELQKKIENALGKNSPRTRDLLRLVAELVPLQVLSRKLAATERDLAEETRLAPSPGKNDLDRRHETQLEAARTLVPEVAEIARKFTVSFIGAVRYLWNAQVRSGAAVQFMEQAGAALSKNDAAAVERMGRAAAELDELAKQLDAAKQSALEEIAERTGGNASPNRRGAASLESALDAVQQASMQMRRGDLSSMRARQRAAMRGLSARIGSLRAYLQGLRDSSGEDWLAGSGLLHTAAGASPLSWRIRTRSSERDPISERERSEAERAWILSDDFPEEYRELVRIYLEALRGEP